MLTYKFFPIAGGAEKQCLLLSKELLRCNFKVFVVTEKLLNTKSKEILEGVPIYRFRAFDKIRKTNRTKQYKNKYINIFIAKINNFLFWTFPNIMFLFLGYIFLFRLRKTFDILHVHESHFVSMLAIIFGKVHNKRVIVKEAGSLGLISRKKKRGIFFSILKKADSFISVSTFIQKKLLKAGINKERISYIPNGVSLPDETELIIRNKVSVLFVGNLSQLRFKGLYVLFEAWKIVLESIPNANLVIAGRGETNELKFKVNTLKIAKSVKFLGYVSNLSRQYKQCTLFVLPSISEGLSNALLEAMSNGCPIVATNISGSQDLIEDGVDGFLVETNNIFELANKIIVLLKNHKLRREFGEKAKKKIRNNYSIENISRKYIQLYRTLASLPPNKT